MLWRWAVLSKAASISWCRFYFRRSCTHVSSFHLHDWELITSCINEHCIFSTHAKFRPIFCTLAAIVCIREQQNGKKGWILFYMRTSQNVWYICSVLFVYDFYFSQTLCTTFLKQMTLPTDDNVFKSCCFCVFEKVLLPKFWLNTTRNVSKLCELDGSGCLNLLICSCWLKPIHEKGKREKNDKENYLFFIPFMHIFYIVGMVYCMYGILYLFIYFEQKLIIL